MNRQTDRQTDRNTDGQTDGHFDFPSNLFANFYCHILEFKLFFALRVFTATSSIYLTFSDSNVFHFIHRNPNMKFTLLRLIVGYNKKPTISMGSKVVKEVGGEA